jgi:hypothetical protein
VRDIAFWLAVAAVAVCAVILFKIVAAKINYAPLQTLAGSI